MTVTEQRLQQMKWFTSSGEHIQQLRAVIMDVWPTEKKISTTSGGTIMFGSELSYQQTCDSHSSHLVIDGCLRLAK